MSPFAAQRRRLLALLGAAGAGPTLASWPTIALAQAESMQVGWYPGLLGANFRTAFLDTFAEAQRVKIVESFDNARFTQMQANRSRPTLHAGVFTDVLLPLIARSGLVAELKPAAVPNLKDLDPKVPLPVGHFAIPLTYGTWGIAYNAKRVRKPVTSWADLVGDDLKGHVSAPNVTYNSSMYTLDAMAALKGGSLRQPDAGLQALRTVRRNGPGLWDQESIAVGWLKTGEIWATPYFSGNVLALQRDPDLADLKFVIPSEGGYALPMNITRVVNPTAGGLPEAFINHTLGVEAQETWARVGGARPVNVKARVPADVQAMVPTADRLRQLDWMYFAEQRSTIVERWNAVVNG